MSQFTAGFSTMELQRATGDSFCDSENLLQSEPSSPEVWEMSPIKSIGKASTPNEVESQGTFMNGGVHFAPSNGYDERGPTEPDDVEQVSGKPEFPDWRRSAILTIFIFPPTGLVAMILACLSHSSARKGDYDRARCLNYCSCWLVFISLLSCLTLILVCILLRVYGGLDDPF